MYRRKRDIPGNGKEDIKTEKWFVTMDITAMSAGGNGKTRPG
jgi:hypothetical protein